MQKTFNLKSFLEKTANYEGAQGYMLAQTRAWMNCTKQKLASKMSPQDAWQSCLDEFQKGDKKMSWVGKYASELSSKITQEGSDYSEKLAANVKAGMPLSEAVVAAIEECGKA